VGLGLVASAFPQVEAEIDCNQICTDIRGHNDLLSSVNGACNKFKYELPRPKVYGACRAGFTQAQTKACLEVCETQGASNGSAAARQQCAGMRSMAPKPKMYNACAIGSAAAAATMQPLVVEALENGGVVVEAVKPEVVKRNVVPEVTKPKVATAEAMLGDLRHHVAVDTARHKVAPDPIAVPDPVVEEVYANPEPVAQETLPEPLTEEHVPEPEVDVLVVPSEEGDDGDEAMRLLEEQIHSME